MGDYGALPLLIANLPLTKKRARFNGPFSFIRRF
jgi:hypothetical protein